MKLLTKLITAISLSTLVCTPLFASTNITITPAPNTSVATSVATIDETTGLPILTLEESIKGALSKNNSLALNSQQHTLLQEQMNSMDDIGAYKYQQIYISYNQKRSTT